jgi:flagellar motor switch protein FliN/FliY
MSEQFMNTSGMSGSGMGEKFGNNEDSSGNINLLMDVNLKVTVELGRTKMQLRQVLELQQGSVVELDRLAGDPVDVYVNERLFARGEVIVVDDKFGVRITEIISVHK